MFLKTKTKNDGNEVNIMIDQITAFYPTNATDKTQGSCVVLSNGITLVVEMSTQSIRGRITKVYGGPVKDQVKS